MMNKFTNMFKYYNLSEDLNNIQRSGVRKRERENEIHLNTNELNFHTKPRKRDQI